MSDATDTSTDSSTTDGTENSGTTSTATNDESKSFTQEEINSLLAKQKRELKAEATEWKTKASKYDELAEANKSEIEKATDRATKAEAEVAKVPNLVADGLRTYLVKLHDIAPERAELYLTASDPELLLKQFAGLVDLDADRKKNGNRVPNEGNASTATDSNEGAFARELFGG